MSGVIFYVIPPFAAVNAPTIAMARKLVQPDHAELTAYSKQQSHWQLGHRRGHSSYS